MKLPEIAANSSGSFKSTSRFTRIDLRSVAWFSLFVLVGGWGIIHPLAIVYCLAVAVALGLCRIVILHVRRAGLEVWQVLLLIALSGYWLLNYGFENLTLHIGGFPIIIGYVLVYASLGLVVLSRKRLIAIAMKEPAVLCMLALIGLTVLHLVRDIPSYGIWALRDATMCLDGMFMLLGMAWARRSNSLGFLTKWMMVVFVLNMLYSLTFPWGEKLWSWSPQSGVFLKVPIIGNYNGAGDLLLTGAVFCICVGVYLIRRPSWLMLFLALVQFLGIAITQDRRVYVATATILLILVLLGEGKKVAKLLIVVPSAIIVIFLVTTVGGLRITGRIGEVNLDFFKDHIRSIQTSEGTPGSSVESRFDMADQALQHFFVHPVVGVGFGQPLISDTDLNTGAVTRMPHNSSLTYLTRLGLIGFAVWIAFHFFLIKKFINALRQRRTCDDKVLSAFMLWLFLFYVLVMIASLVEAPFEFPSGAIPFYFFMGLALGLMRWQLADKNKREPRPAVFASGAELNLIKSAPSRQVRMKKPQMQSSDFGMRLRDL